MPTMLFKPELKTSGGEVVDLFHHEKYLGTMTLVYREMSRLLGVVNLDDEHVSTKIKERVFSDLQTYLESVVVALDLEQCEVIVFYRGCQYVIDLDSLSEITVDDKNRTPVRQIDEDGYNVHLIRDDRDTLIYEITHSDDDDTPIAMATIDISNDELSGTLDFQEPVPADERELLATLVLEEIDKEKEYDKINLTIYVQNKYMDEILFEHEETNR